MTLMDKKTIDRYKKQIILPDFGEIGQEKLLNSKVAIVGIGALGTVAANNLARVGVGTIKLIDRDYVELSNLQRQMLFDEEDIELGYPKAIAAANKLKKVNSNINILPFVEDLNRENIEGLIKDVDIVIDGTDNFETRFLINEACVKHHIPWVYAGVVGTNGMTMMIIPRETPCFRCMMEEIPPPGSMPTCDTAGILGTVSNLVASLESTEVIKYLMGAKDKLIKKLIYIDAWEGSLKTIDIQKTDDNCPVCDQKVFEFLDSDKRPNIVSLCGQNAVQINRQDKTSVDLKQMAESLKKIGEVKFNDYMLKLILDDYEFSVFPDGRTIIKGTTDEFKARSLLAKYIGI